MSDPLRIALVVEGPTEGWLGEQIAPPRVVLCTPSKSLETWVLVGLFPQDTVGRRADVECHATPEAQLQNKPAGTRLIRSGQKQLRRYLESEDAMRVAWPRVRARCSEAERFSIDLLALAQGA